MKNKSTVLKKCNSCNESKKLNRKNYYTREYTKDGYNNVCINCILTISKARDWARSRGINFSLLNLEQSKQILKDHLSKKTIEDKEKKEKETVILELFYRTELENDEKIIDNSDRYISEKLKMPINTVSYIIYKHLTDKFLKLNKQHETDRNTITAS